jgi:hypothetical protein
VTQSINHPHHDFFKDSLPAWYINATDELRQRLQRDMVRGQFVRPRLAAALADIQGLSEFARPLLVQALEQEFGPGLNVDADYFFHSRSADSVLPLPGKLVSRSGSVQSLLQAALQNFHEEEVAAVKAESAIFHNKPDLNTLADGSSYPHPLKVSPAKFIALCRDLDLGGKYQAHLSDVLDLRTEVAPGRLFTAAQIKDLWIENERNALYVEAHIAHMKGEQNLSAAAYRAVLASTGHPGGQADGSVTISSLSLLGFSVRDVLVFQLAGQSGCVVYLPGEATSPLKEYASFDLFMQALRTQLRGTAYQAYFAGFIAQRSRAAFLSRLNERLTPQRVRPMPGDTRLIPQQWSVAEVDEHADLQLERRALPYALGEFIYFQKMLRIKDDARALAVPTGDEDEASRRARLAGYIEQGMDIVNLAALFVPVLGEAMMVVAGAQLLTETFEGVAAWRHGDMDEALDHLGGVAKNLALMAAFGAAGRAAAPADLAPIKGSNFVGKMIPVQLEDGQTRLWSPDLAPFAHDLSLPQGLRPSAEGVFTHEGQHYIPLEGSIYRIRHDADLNMWRIVPPRGKGFAPALEHNGAGAWRHEGENPLAWDRRTAFKRLGHAMDSLSEQSIDNILAVTGADEPLLVNLHLENQAPPAALSDTVQRFKFDEQLRTFNEQLNDGAQFELADPRLQLHLLPSLPGWPEGRRIHVLDAGATELAEQGVHVLPAGRSVVITQAQFATGKLLEAVLEGLSEAEKTSIFGPRKPPTAMNLAFELGRLSVERGSSLFDSLYQATQASSDPMVGLIRRDFPGISSAVAQELLAELDAAQITEMRTRQRLPFSLSGRARGYLQEAQVNRALEGFFLAAKGDNPDTRKIALHLLERLPGWPQDLRIEVRDGAFGGPLLDGIGERSTTQRRILVKRGAGFQAVDMQGNPLQTNLLERENFFSAVLHALPEASRQAIGFTDADALRERVISLATNARGQVANILGQQQIKPGFRGPRRLADGRFGYQLSGRGQRGDYADGSQPLIDLLRILYPEAPDLVLHVQGLRLRGWTQTQLMASTQARLRAYEVLRSALEGWVETPVAGSSQNPDNPAVRRSVAESISRAWRSRDPHSPLYTSNLLLENIDLSRLDSLPALPDHYAEIHYLTLRNVTGDADQINALIDHFPGLTRLEILEGSLTALPSGLRALTQLNHLCIGEMGMTIDQEAMNMLMDLPHLRELDLSGNILGAFTDTSRLHVSILWLNQTGLTQWPQWTEALPLEALDISNNQIEQLPEYIINNSSGDDFFLTIHAYSNPIAHDQLRRYWLNDHGYGMTYRLQYDFPDDIRQLHVDPLTSSDDSSDDDVDWHFHTHHPVVPPVPVPNVELWQVPHRTELNSRIRVGWQSVEAAGDAPNLLILLQRLRETPDFLRFHEELANDVMRVLEAAAADAALRNELEVIANDRLFGADQTCEDGARLIFSDVQVAVYSRAALQGVPPQHHTQALFRVLRNLFRLNEVQAIADQDIASRESRGIYVDHAEVRLAYRIGLASELSLPAQPLSMVFERLAAVSRQVILDARRVVLERETGPAFLDYMLSDRRWTERLRAEHQADLERVTASIKAQMAALEERPPIDVAQDLALRAAIYERLGAAHAASDQAAMDQATRDMETLRANPPINADEYDRQGRALMASLVEAEKALLEQLTNNLRQDW